MFISARDRGVLLGSLEVLLGLLEDGFLDYSWCLFVGIFWGFNSKSTRL